MTTDPLLPLSGCSYGWLHQAPLVDALRALAEHGYRTFELTTAPPHFYTSHAGWLERHQLRKTLESLELQPISVNPGFVDINLISTNPGIQAESERQMAAEIELASDIGASFVVVIPGRRHALAPAPDEACRSAFRRAIERLLHRAERLGVVLAMENSPYGYLGRGADLLEIADEFDSPNLGITYDVANALALEDPTEGLRQIAHRLQLVHISDTWHDRWAHTSAGRGEVDFAAFAGALREIRYSGPTVYELIDLEPVEPRIRQDLAALRTAGWAPEVEPSLPRLGGADTPAGPAPMQTNRGFVAQEATA